MFGMVGTFVTMAYVMYVAYALVLMLAYTSVRRRE